MSVTRIRDWFLHWFSLSVAEAVSLVIAVFVMYVLNQVLGLELWQSFVVVLLSGIGGVIWGYDNAKRRE